MEVEGFRFPLFFVELQFATPSPYRPRMAAEMSVRHVPLTIIVAATAQNGIGKNGTLPWPMIKKEMAYFARITKRVPKPTNTGSMQSDPLKQSVLDGTQRNAVIMGRKTWDSIPPKFRPLKDRTNIVISSQPREQLETVTDDVVVAKDITSGLESFAKAVSDGKALPLGRAFVIGGNSIYQSALGLPQTKHILLSRIHTDYDCDTFFPENLVAGSSSESSWVRKSEHELSEFVGEEVPSGLVSERSGDQDVQFEYQLYERP